LVGATIVVFVPYNLPAPSYNTLGMQAAIAACASFGCARMAALDQRRWSPWLLLSATAWAAAVLAYPALLLPAGALFLLMVLLLRPGRRFVGVYFVLLGASHLLAVVLVLAVFGLRRMRDSMAFQPGLSSNYGLQSTLAFFRDLLAHHRLFLGLLALALLLGALRRRLPFRLCVVADALILVALLVLPPALYSTSHGIVLAAALAGIAIVLDARRRADAEAKLLATLYITSLIAGVAMASTTALPPLKLPLAMVLAAAIAVGVTAKRGHEAGHPYLAPLPALALWSVLTATMFGWYYGELPGPGDRVRSRHGAFAGLAASSPDARLIEIASAALRNHERAGDTIVVLGRFPGLSLLSAAPLRALGPYPLTEFAQPVAIRTVRQYYASPTNRPSLVLVYRDPHFKIIDPFAPDFDSWYALQASLPTLLGRIDIYRDKTQPDRPR
jgi:hypothetical protein